MNTGQTDTRLPVGESFYPANRQTGSQRLEIRSATSFEEIASVREEWNNLVTESSSTIFQTYEWLSTWWDHFGKQHGRALQLLLIYDNQRLVGIAPLFVKTGYLFGRPAYRCLCLAGSGDAFNRSYGMFLDDGPSDYLDMIVHPHYTQAVAQHLTEYLKNNSTTFDEIELLNLPQGSFIHTSLLPAMRMSGFVCTVTEADECPRLTMNSSVEELLRSLNASTRRRLSQAMKAAAEKTIFALHPPTSRADVIATLDELMILHQRRWRKMGYPGLFSKKEFSDFQFAITRAFLPNGWIYIKRAVAEGRTVAARFCFIFNGRFYDYLSGFADDAPAAKRRPGMAILLSMMQELFDSNVREIDFLRGDEAYKFELTSTSFKNLNIVSSLPIPRNKFDRVLLSMARRKSFIAYLLEREWNLLKVQYHEHHIPKCFYYYAKFRSGRFINKFFPSSTAATGEGQQKS
jgi:CelD/BcsL family acetyltransferase involved in cellulose biosynthesis